MMLTARIGFGAGGVLHLLAVCAIAAFPARGATQSAHTVLVVQVRPEVVVSRQGPDAITVRIRLAEGTQALLWRATSCGVPESNAYRIERSGVHSISISAIPGLDGGRICLASSDATLALTLGAAGMQASAP